MSEDVNGADLVLNRVSKQYRAGKVIINEISGRFRPGEATLLYGPNGSGKTTFLRLLSVNTFPSSGEIHYGEIDIHRHPYRYLNHVGLVHDEESLPQHLSATELLEWVLRSRELWSDGSEERIDHLLNHLELDEESRQDEIGTYSTGMRKKAQIAAAFITEPPVLILDEPLRGLDKTATVKVVELLQQAVGRGGILLMASHSRQVSEELFNRVLTFPLSGSELPSGP